MNTVHCSPVKKCTVKKIEWLEKAAKAGDLQSMVQYAELFDDGE